MRAVPALMMLSLCSLWASAQELAPSTNVQQPVVQQASATQTGVQISFPQQPVATSAPVQQNTAAQPIPPSLSTPLYLMPTQPNAAQPLATLCTCGQKR